MQAGSCVGEYAVPTMLPYSAFTFDVKGVRHRNSGNKAAPEDKLTQYLSDTTLRVASIAVAPMRILVNTCASRSLDAQTKFDALLSDSCKRGYRLTERNPRKIRMISSRVTA